MAGGLPGEPPAGEVAERWGAVYRTQDRGRHRNTDQPVVPLTPRPGPGRAKVRAPVRTEAGASGWIPRLPFRDRSSVTPIPLRPPGSTATGSVRSAAAAGPGKGTVRSGPDGCTRDATVLPCRLSAGVAEWQTRPTQNRMPQGMRVRLPPPAHRERRRDTRSALADASSADSYIVCCCTFPARPAQRPRCPPTAQGTR